MRTLADQVPTRYAWGVARADDTPDSPITYEPVTAAEATEAASEPWSADDLDGWLDAESRDRGRDSGGGW